VKKINHPYHRSAAITINIDTVIETSIGISRVTHVRGASITLVSHTEFRIVDHNAMGSRMSVRFVIDKSVYVPHGWRVTNQEIEILREQPKVVDNKCPVI
jgi:hypothetical protein